MLFLLMTSTCFSDPVGFRESITEQNLIDAGLDPQKYEVNVPLTSRLSFKRETVWVGEQGTFSTGTTERTKDSIQLNLNKRGSFSLLQDYAAAVGPSGFVFTESTQRTLSLAQGVGSGEVSFSRVNDETRDVLAGTNRSQIDTAKLQYEFGSHVNLTSAITTTDQLAANLVHMKVVDVAIHRKEASAEFHTTDRVVDGVTSSLKTMAFRSPVINLSNRGTITASHLRSESSVKGSNAITSIGITAQPHERVAIIASYVDTNRDVGGDETVSSVTVNATPVEGVSVNMSHTDTERSDSPDTVVSTVASQAVFLSNTTLSAAFSNISTQGVGVSTRRSVTIARLPEDSSGLGVSASYTSLGNTGTDIDSTVDLKLLYEINKDLQITGTYHDEDNRQEPEIGGSLKVPILGAAVNLNFHEYSYDAAKKIVYQQRVWNADITREIAWGMSGIVGYSMNDSLIDPTQTSRIRLGISGENDTVGRLGLNYEVGKLHTSTGNTQNGSAISISLAKEVGTADVSLSAKRTLPPGKSVNASDEIRIDVNTAW